MEDFISKKDLLKLTDISYGQLYRWKRQRLIPESWFVKQSTFTGQETFFPRERILERISTILAAKDRYSLDQLAEMFSPESAEVAYSRQQLSAAGLKAAEWTPLLEKRLNKSEFTFMEVLFLELAGRLHEEKKLSDDEIERMSDCMPGWLTDVKTPEFRFMVFRSGGEIIFVLAEANAAVLPGLPEQVTTVVYLEELSKDLRMRLNTRMEGL